MGSPANASALSRSFARVALLAACLGVVASGCAEQRRDLQLAQAYAPIVFQDVAKSRYDGAADLPLRFDFDGNQVGDDNWSNFDGVVRGERSGDRRAFLYYSVIESETHWFIGYALFYPQDWDDKWLLKRWREHENDLEPLLVVVEKTSDDPLGRMVLLETQAHDQLYVYGDPAQVGPGALRLSGPILRAGRHPRVFVEAKGHGCYGHHETLDTGRFPGGDGFVLEQGRPQNAYDPSLGKSRKASTRTGRLVTYGLLPTLEKLFPLAFGPRFGDGAASDMVRPYRGGRFSFQRPIGFALQGREKAADAAKWPWGQDAPDDGPVYQGDWFLDPAYSVSMHVSLTGRFSQRYQRNPYLEALRIAERMRR